MAKSGPGGGWSWSALEIQIQIQLQIPRGVNTLKNLDTSTETHSSFLAKQRHEVESRDGALFKYKHKFNCNTREQI